MEATPFSKSKVFYIELALAKGEVVENRLLKVGNGLKGGKVKGREIFFILFLIFFAVSNVCFCF